MEEEDKNLNIEETNELKAPKLWAFSDSERKKLSKILGVDEINEIEQKRIEKQKSAEIRKNKIIYLLNKEYSLSDESWFWKNNDYIYYDEWSHIIVSHKWNSRAFEFNWSGFWYNSSAKYRMIEKIWNGYVGVIATVSGGIKKEKVLWSEVYSILNNKWVKKYSLSEKLKPYSYIEDLYIDKNKIKNNYKVFTVYDKDLNLLVKHVPEWFRILSTLNWEILFQKQQLDIAGEDFVVMHQWDNREEKRVWEYALKDSPIYEEYLSKLDDDKK